MSDERPAQRGGMLHRLDVNLPADGLDFEAARRYALSLAAADSPDAMLISWNDRQRGLHSPQCLKCEIGDLPGWEVYGANHGGRLRISVNDDLYVFIYS